MSGPELRQFGLLFGAILVSFFGLLLPFLIGYSFPLWPWVVALLFTAMALLAANALTPFYRGWMRFGLIAAFIGFYPKRGETHGFLSSFRNGLYHPPA